MTMLFAETQPGQAEAIKAFSNAKKLFQVSKLPLGVLTYGGGNIGKRSIESFLTEFSELITKENPQSWTVESITERLLNFIREPYAKQHADIPVEKQPRVGFYVAGYSPAVHLASELEFVLPVHNAPIKPRGDDQFGASWRGVSIPFTRLHFGMDPRVLSELVKEGVSDDVVKKIDEVARRFRAPVVFDGMPVQDAIGFCKFILETTIGQATYELGFASCGGPVHLAVITRGDGFTWVSRVSYSA